MYFPPKRPPGYVYRVPDPAHCERIADREAQLIVAFIRARILARAEHMDVTVPDEPIAIHGAMQALAEIVADIEARRHRTGVPGNTAMMSDAPLADSK